MQIITINLPEKYLETIQILNDLKVYPSRSEAIRVALHNFLTKELGFNLELSDMKVVEKLFKSNTQGGRN